jgi:DNA-binding cell septation regulator SpoVG
MPLPPGGLIDSVTIGLHAGRSERVKAHATAHFAIGLKIASIRVVLLPSGQLYVAMPSRKVLGKCPACGHSEPVANSYCGQCGMRMRGGLQPGVRPTEDVAYPTNNAVRMELVRAVLGAYEALVEMERERGEVA